MGSYREASVGDIVYRSYRPTKLAVVRKIEEKLTARPDFTITELTIEYEDGSTEQVSQNHVRSLDLLIDDHLRTAKNHKARRENFLSALAEKEGTVNE